MGWDRTKRKRKFQSVETRLEVDASSYTHTYIYISSSSSSLNRLLRKRSVPANCNSDSADRNSRLPEILQASSEGIPGAKLSSCRSNEEISSESRIRTSIFEDFSASCFPNSRCAKIQDPASF